VVIAIGRRASVRALTTHVKIGCGSRSSTEVNVVMRI
jgi:hypothetical protein